MSISATYRSWIRKNNGSVRYHCWTLKFLRSRPGRFPCRRETFFIMARHFQCSCTSGNWFLLIRWCSTLFLTYIFVLIFVSYFSLKNCINFFTAYCTWSCHEQWLEENIFVYYFSAHKKYWKNFGFAQKPELAIMIYFYVLGVKEYENTTKLLSIEQLFTIQPVSR